MGSNNPNTRGTYLKPKKMGRRTRHAIPKSKQKNGGVRKLKANLEAMLEREQKALNELVRLRDIRIAYVRGMKLKADPILVAADFDEQVGLLHDTNPKEFPEWDELTDAAKARIGFLLSLAFDGYSFTANVSKKLEDSWVKKGLNPRDRAIDKINKELRKVGLGNAPFFFAIEGKGRGGRSKKRLHLHGYCLVDTPLEATKFKLALERALYRELNPPRGEGAPVKMTRSYQLNDEPQNATYWVGYSTKNAMLPGPRIEESPLYLNTPLTQCAHIFWDIVREVD